MLSLQTDLALPKDVSRIRIQVLRGDGAVRFDTTYNVGDGPEDSKIPATLGIVGDEAGEAVEVRVIGFRGTEARTLNKVVTTMPATRTALLRMPIQWLCDGEVTELDSDTYESTREPVDGVEHVCVAGTCVPVDVDSETLPAYTPGAVFGGGNGQQGNGKCFAVEDCMQGDNGFDVTPDMEDCSVEVPAEDDEPINVGLKTGKRRRRRLQGRRVLRPARSRRKLRLEEGPEDLLGHAQSRPARPRSARASRTAEPRACERAAPATRKRQTFRCAGRGRACRVKAGAAAAVLDLVQMRAPAIPTCARASSPARISVTLTGDPELDEFLQASSDLKRRAEELKGDTVAACLAILNALGQPGSVGNPPTDQELTDVCTSARDALGAQGATISRSSCAKGSAFRVKVRSSAKPTAAAPRPASKSAAARSPVRAAAPATATATPRARRLATRSATASAPASAAAKCSDPQAPGGCGEVQRNLHRHLRRTVLLDHLRGRLRRRCHVL